MEKKVVGRTVRQLASGLLYAIVSVTLVIGSLSLALAEHHPATAPASSLTALPTRIAAEGATPTAPSTVIEAPSANPTAIGPASSTPTVAAIVFPTLPVQARATTGPTQSCGPFAGWIRGYTVQAGDTLFGIATRYHTTVPQLQRANCRISTAIFSGETLWVPNVPMVTPGITTIPTFDTPTDWPTETGTAGEPSLTAAPPTPTVTVDP